ncbi:hypothetical protein PENTCL1PPCAC_3708, partial [Pristionchus entomophagus]
MNSTELNANISDSIITFHHVSDFKGVIFFLINILVCFLILFDTDSRGKAYRKYLLSLQISSMILDITCNAYAPILLINSHIVYSDSWLVKHIDISV